VTASTVSQDRRCQPEPTFGKTVPVLLSSLTGIPSGDLSLSRLLPRKMPRETACASGWPGSRIRGPGPAAGTGWSSCWPWRSARTPRPGMRRQSRSLNGEHKEIAYGITSLPPGLAGPRQLACCARQHWGIENREHYATSPSAKTPRKPAPGTSPAPAPSSATSSSAPSAGKASPTSPRPPLLRTRRPAHPRPLRICLKPAPGTSDHITQTRRGREH
jgi:hypothetical protein